MPGPLHDTVTPAPRRADYGQVRLGRRDIDGLILCAEHFDKPPRTGTLRHRHRKRDGQSGGQTHHGPLPHHRTRWHHRHSG